MGSGGFNRQAYVSRQSRPPRKSSGALGGLLIFVLLVVLGVLGFAGYKYVEANGLPDLGLEPGAPADDPDTILAKLEEIEKRLERLERRQRATPEPDASAEAADESGSPAKDGARSRDGANQAASTQAANSPSVKPGVSDRESTNLERQYTDLAGQVAANEERWDAASDRLTDTVTGLNEQRKQTAEQRARLNKLWERFERVPVDFDLHKRDGKKRVGPLMLWLRNTNVDNHRYTMRVLVDDNWIEFKDRALMESLELYLREVPVPFQLLVTEVSRDRVAGTLSVPERLPER